MAERDRFELELAAALRAYAQDAPTHARPTELARQFAAAYPHRGPMLRSWRLVAIPRLAWTLLLLATLLAAMVAGMLVVGSQLQRRLVTVVPTHRPAPQAVALAATGIDELAPDPGAYGRLVQDGVGILWVREDGGRLVRFDPASGSARTWTVGNDAAFETTDIAPAVEGGVWLLNGYTLRRFDGDVFQEVIRALAPISAVAEAPDTTLWAATTDGLVLHWSGSSWTSLEPERPVPGASAVISAIAVDSAGRPWIGWSQDSSVNVGSVSRYDGSGWRTFDGEDTSLLGRAVNAIVPLPDGEVWVSTGGGLARFDGTSWTDETAGLLPGGHALAAGPDGSVWATDGRSIGAVARFDGQSWVYHGPPNGLPGGPWWVAPTKEGAYLGTTGGIFRLASDRWERAWPLASPTNLKLLLAVSRDELWARDGDGHARGWTRGDSGLWHLRDGAWTNEPIDPGLATYGPDVLAYAPDGTLWAAGEAGLAYRRDGRWTVVDTGPADPSHLVDGAASAIAFDARGTVWVGGTVTQTVGWQVGVPRLWRVSFDGTSWVRETIKGCPIDPMSLAVDRAGALWVGDSSGGLARFDGHAWETIHELGGARIDGAAVLGTAPDGALWVAAWQRSPEGAGGRGPGAPPRRAEMDVRRRAPRLRGGGSRGDLVLAPDGTLWASSYRGPAHYDGRSWWFPHEDRIPAAVAWGAPTYMVARDGTVFSQTPNGIARFPAEAAQP